MSQEKGSEIVPLTSYKNFLNSPEYSTKVLLSLVAQHLSAVQKATHPVSQSHMHAAETMRTQYVQLKDTLKELESQDSAFLRQMTPDSRRARARNTLETAYRALLSTYEKQRLVALNHMPTPEGDTFNRITVVSNRLPIKIERASEGDVRVLASPGGITTTIDQIMRRGIGGRWVGWPGVDNYGEIADSVSKKFDGGYAMSAVELTEEQEKRFYEGYSTQVLYPLFLGKMDGVKVLNATTDWKTYVETQSTYADKVCEDIQSGDLIWVQDYNLIGVGRALREKGVRQPMGIFLHTPFPTRENFSTLKDDQQKYLIGSLLSYDLVGLQNSSFRNNFFECVKMVYPSAVISHEDADISLVEFENRTVRVGRFPISIDVDDFYEKLYLPETQRNITRIKDALGKMGDVKLIFNAGRLDPNKGFLEELLAFEKILDAHPELVGKVVLYQLVVPSRDHLETYKEYKDKIIATSQRINKKFRKSIILEEGDHTASWDDAVYPGRPVRQVHGAMGSARFKAHLGATDVAHIPTKADGMNLVMKEASIGGKVEMVGIIGNNAGVVEELGEYALVIDSEDIDGMAKQLYRALTMAPEEKRERHRQMKKAVESHTLLDWWEKGLNPAFEEIWREKVAVANRGAKRQ